jgi:lipopolysaccharide export system ATP-binding protein
VRETTQIRAHHQVDALAHGDRSIGFALHSLLSAADDNGVAPLSRVAMVYRDDYLASLRAEGRDADQEAGRLSLDEVRAHLTGSVLPRLAGDSILSIAIGAEGGDPIITFSPAVWKDLRSARAEIAASLKASSEQNIATAESALTASGIGISAPSGSVLEASGLIKMYRRRRVVNDVALRLQQGEIVGLLGPNGAGKTTTFYMIVGLVRPDTGAISLDGSDITRLPMYRRARLGIGYLPQEASVFRGLNVEQNVMAALEVIEPDAATRDMMLDELLAEFGISHLRRTPALALSGGERRRVEIARALATQPSYILLDEPLAGIDPIAVAEIRDLVKHLKDRGIGVLITDHNVRETLDIIDRAYIMHDGQLLMEGKPGEVVAHEDVRRVYLGEKFSL